jgi:hypothetical protein
VISVETDPGIRPANYSEEVRELLAQHDYYDCCGQVGRNLCKIFCYFCLSSVFYPKLTSLNQISFYEIGFLRKGFVPSIRPGLDKNCWNGLLKVSPKRKDESVKCEVKV